jgi:hypothetical protein
LPGTLGSTPSPIAVQIACTVARIDAPNALYLLIELHAYLPTCEPASNLPANLLANPPANTMGKRLHPTKVLEIRSMLLETNDMYAISEALKVSYAAVAYHKRKMDQKELNGGVEFKLPVGRRHAIGPGFIEVCIYKLKFIFLLICLMYRI